MGELALEPSDAVAEVPAQRRRGWFGWTALALGWLAFAAVLVPVICRVTGYERGPLIILVSLLPWVTLACAVPLVFALLARSWLLAGASGAVLALCLAWLVPLFTAQGGGSDPVLTVAAVNVTLGGADADAVVALVREKHVDVLSVVELTPESRAALAAAGLDDELPFSIAIPEPNVPGTGMWSRYPISDPSEVPGFHSHAVSARVAAPAGTFTFFAVHPEAPGPRIHPHWSQDMANLAAVLASTSGPVIVAGDFNGTRDTKAFRAIESLGYADAADQAGAGFLATFPENRELFPMVAIDHVMEGHTGWHATSVTTTTIPKADHKAFVVTYAAD